MARKGRDLEHLISILEKGLSSSEVVIQSPDYIDDIVTGEKREVDVSIRKKEKPGNVLVVLECRDRRFKEDVTWIEQLYTKTKDIGAPKVVAVSSSGFSEGARLKAQHYGIELRTLEEISNENLNNWIIPSSLTFLIQHSQIIDMVIISDDTRFQTVSIPFDIYAKCFKSGNHIFRPFDLLKQIPKERLPQYDETNERISKEFRFDFRTSDVQFYSGSEWVKIDGFEMTIEFWNEESHFESKKMFTYSDESGRLVGGSVFPVIIGGREFYLTTHTYKNQGVQVVKSTLSPRDEN